MIKRIVNEMDENTFILYENEKAFVIDPGLSKEKIMDFIVRCGLNLQGILLTHGHYDHIAGVNALMELKKVPVYIHPLDAAFLIDSDLNLSPYIEKAYVLMDKKWIVPLKATTKLNLQDKDIRFVHTPGHTEGSVTYVYDGCLFTGDTLFRETVGRTDLPKGSASQLSKSIKKLLTSFKGDVLVYPGHGKTTTIAHEINRNPFYKSA